MALIFTKKRISNTVLNLTINGNKIKYENEAKFLGVIFDNKNTWNSHIDKIVDKCKSRINLLRSVSGHQWGANKKTLLMMYRALIRSRLDYGSQLFHTASATALKKLDTIQSTCLRLICGAMRGTATSSLQQDTGEMPLGLRRKELLLRIAVKLNASKNNPAKSVLQESWEHSYGKFKKGMEPILNQIKLYSQEISNDSIVGPIISKIPPWHMSKVNVNISLSNKITKKDNPNVQKSIAIEFMSQYENSIHIFTDGSRTEDKKVSSAFYVPSQNLLQSYRLTDKNSIYTAELVAILKSVQWIENAQPGKYVIFSDSLSSLVALDSQYSSSSRPNLLLEICSVLNQVNKKTLVEFAWIPSHVGIRGNEVADGLAKTATDRLFVDEVINQELKDACNNIKNYIMYKWQEYYDDVITGTSYKILEPKVSKTIKYSYKQRSKEVLVTRLRLGRC